MKLYVLTRPVKLKYGFIGNMKRVILYGGHGTKLKTLTYAGSKQLIPIANKSVSQYMLEDLRNSGIRNIAVVLGETYRSLLESIMVMVVRFSMKITYVYQE